MQDLLLNIVNQKISIYEVRGMRHIIWGSRYLYYHNKLNNKFEEYVEGEKFCIQNCTKPLFITTQLEEYATNMTKYNQFKSLNCKIKKFPIFWNCFEINEKIKKEKTDKFIIGYVGSIVFYEGIIGAILSIEKFISKHKKSIEFHLVGDWQKIVEVKNEIYHQFSKTIYKTIWRVPYWLKMNLKFDLYIIPRLDLCYKYCKSYKILNQCL